MGIRSGTSPHGYPQAIPCPRARTSARSGPSGGSGKIKKMKRILFTVELALGYGPRSRTGKYISTFETWKVVFELYRKLDISLIEAILKPKYNFSFWAWKKSTATGSAIFGCRTFG
ncbi:hypothetical protein VTI74DRAFT_8577 [Chaetomium olivicolor]